MSLTLGLVLAVLFLGFALVLFGSILWTEWKNRQNARLHSEFKALPIETFGLQRDTSPNLPNFYGSIKTDDCKSEFLLRMIGKWSSNDVWLAVPWFLVQRLFDEEETSEPAGDYPHRISGLAREYSDLISGTQNQYPSKVLFNGVKHAVEQGYIEVVNGPEEDYLCLTDKGIALFL